MEKEEEKSGNEFVPWEARARNVKINIQMKIDGAKIYLTLRELSPESISSPGGQPIQLSVLSVDLSLKTLSREKLNLS